MGVSKQESIKSATRSSDANSSDESAELTDTQVLGEDEFADTNVWESNKELTENSEGSVEINVESLVAEFEAEAGTGVDADGRIRKHLEAIAERKRRHEELKDFSDYDID
jgi:hypothetical protein